MIYAIPDKIYTLEEYLDLDFRTDAKYEFFDGELVEISGVAINHALINGNVLSILHTILAEDFQPWIGSMKLKVPALPPYRYPNFSVSPKKSRFEMVGQHQCLTNPIVIGEIYSPETEFTIAAKNLRLTNQSKVSANIFWLTREENLLRFIPNMMSKFGFKVNMLTVKH